MRILVTAFAFAPRVGGEELMTELLCREFVTRGHEVCVATKAPEGDVPLTFPFQVIRRPGPAEYIRLCRWADINMLVGVHLKQLSLAVVSGRRLVIRHNYDYDTYRLGRLKYLVSRYLPGIAVSRFLQEETHSKNLILNPYNTDVFKNWTPWADRKADIIFVGRLVRHKGAHLLIDALAALHNVGQTPKLTIVGQGPERAALEEQAARLSLTESIRFTGPLSHKELAAEYNNHRVLVVPTLIREGFGTVASEGLACGCSVVVPNIGGLPDAVGSHGVQFQAGDAAALSSALDRILAYRTSEPPELADVSNHLKTMERGAVGDRYLRVLESLV